jgi:hypothetical protein
MAVYKLKPLTWYFRLEGRSVDITALTEQFPTTARWIDFGDGRCHLAIDLQFTTADAHAAVAHVEELLSKFNGIAHVIYANHLNVEIDGASCREFADRPPTQIVYLKGIASEARVSMPSIGDHLFEIAEQNEHFLRAVYLYGALPHDWRGLYMVLEAIEDGNGNQKSLAAKDWVKQGLIKAFRGTANSFRVLGRDARHGKADSSVPSNTLTLQTANSMIRDLLERWAGEL